MMWATRQGIICSMSHYNTQDYTLYQVKIDADTKRVHVACLGIYCVDNELEEWYDCVNDLPKWVQEKLAVLMMLEPTGLKKPMLNRGEDGVLQVNKPELGYRINDNEFYITLKEGEKVNGKD